ncbi:MAG: glutamate formimidoyltransferase [Gemmatimonadota bacterium]|nr:glutamate formimidoyltransferase [Gemmatimonadota bacterium]
MIDLLLCEPNISEGRDARRVEAFAEVVARSPGVRLIHRSDDPDHNRMVLAYLGRADDVVEATLRLAAEVFEQIDLRTHEGRHPRIGALDVVPFVPSAVAGEAGTRAALAACRRVGGAVGELGVPVFYYEDAATAPHRRALPDVRRGGLEGLASRMETPEWRPDEGPTVIHPAAGAVIVGVRRPLIRFNVNLGDADPAVAQAIARAIRESSGGLPGVRALGLALASRGESQVTMNLTDYRRTSLAVLHEAVVSRAAARGVDVVGTEVIGPIPRAALVGVASDILEGLETGQILDHV